MSIPIFKITVVNEALNIHMNSEMANLIADNLLSQDRYIEPQLFALAKNIERELDEAYPYRPEQEQSPAPKTEKVKTAPDTLWGHSLSQEPSKPKAKPKPEPEPEPQPEKPKSPWQKLR